MEKPECAVTTSQMLRATCQIFIGGPNSTALRKFGQTGRQLPNG